MAIIAINISSDFLSVFRKGGNVELEKEYENVEK